MISPIMDRSLELSRIRRLDEMTQAADNWLEEENVSKVKDGQRFEPKKNVSFFSTTAFKECHKDDRIEIVNAVAKRLSASRQKKELTVLFLARTHDAITKAANKQRKSLATIAEKQIKEGQWNDRLKTIPSAVLIHRIVPFLQRPVENPPALSYVFDLHDANRTDAFAETYLDSYVGSRSRAAVRFQALKMLTVSPQFVNNKVNILLRQIQTTLPILARTDDTTPSCFALCPTDNERLIGLLQKSSQENFKPFVELNNATNTDNWSFHAIWCEIYKTKGTTNLTEDQERCLTGTINPTIRLFKEIQVMKHELAFTSYSPDLCAESPTIAKLPKVLLLHSLAPYLPKWDLGSLKDVNKSFNDSLSTPLCAHSGSGSIDSLTAFFEKYRDAAFDLEREKAHAGEFLEIFNAMTLKDQRTFRKLLWVVGEYKAANEKGETFSEQIVGKQSHILNDRAVLAKAHGMMLSLDTLKELADRFDEEGVDDAEIAAIQQDYQKIPWYVRERVDRLACAFIYGVNSVQGIVVNSRAQPTVFDLFSGFKKRGAEAKAYALACRLLAEGSFKLMSKDARTEGLRLSRTLSECSGHFQLDHVTARSAYAYYIKHPKAQNLLVKAVEILENCPGEGQNYIQGTASDKAGYSKPFDVRLFANLVYALAPFV
jgi:hypothetical protein